MESEPWDDMVVVGRVARGHGKRGEVIVNLETDFAESRFREGGKLYISINDCIRLFHIARVRFQSGRPVLALSGVETMDEANSLAGHELRVPTASLHSLPLGMYYQHDLVGCDVTTIGGMLVGTVSEVRGAAGANRLIVRPPSHAEEIDVPLAEPICVLIDPENRSIVIDPPKGLLELNQRQ